MEKIATASNGFTRYIYCTACKTIHGFSTGPKGWQYNDNAEKPTISPSLKVTYPGKNDYCCHSIVTEGKIAYCSDCSHEYAGKTIDLEDFPHDRFEIS